MQWTILRLYLGFAYYVGTAWRASVDSENNSYDGLDGDPAEPSFKLATTPPSLVHTTIHTQTHAMVSERTPIQFECLLTSEELEVVCNNRRIGDSCDVTSILLSTASDQNCSARLERRSLSLPLWKR